MKYLALFCAALLLITGVRLFGRQDEHRISIETKGVNRGAKPSPGFVPFPEDVVLFSAEAWQARLGCETSSLHYIGYSTQPDSRFFVIRDGKNERLYEVGDALPGQGGARIISVDEQRILIRDAQNIHVLCHDALPTVKNHPVLFHNNEDEKIYSSQIGDVSPVVNSKGIVTGYRLQACHRYCWLLKSLSLQVGDIITSVQGRPVAGLSLLQIKDRMMSQQQDISITVERAGRSQSISLPWSTIKPLLAMANKAFSHE